MSRMVLRFQATAGSYGRMGPLTTSRQSIMAPKRKSATTSLQPTAKGKKLYKPSGLFELDDSYESESDAPAIKRGKSKKAPPFQTSQLFVSCKKDNVPLTSYSKKNHAPARATGNLATLCSNLPPMTSHNACQPAKDTPPTAACVVQVSDKQAGKQQEKAVADEAAVKSTLANMLPILAEEMRPLPMDSDWRIKLALLVQMVGDKVALLKQVE